MTLAVDWDVKHQLKFKHIASRMSKVITQLPKLNLNMKNIHASKVLTGQNSTQRFLPDHEDFVSGMSFVSI